MKRLVIAMCMMMPVIGGAATTDAITQFEVTFTFSAAHEYGQFANGDYWVVGPVTIASIAPDADSGQNGWQVNPTVGGSHAWDSRAVNGYNSALMPSLPYTSSASESIVKAVSLATRTDSSYVARAVCLTVVPAAPSAGGAGLFRPPYHGTDKPQHAVASLQTGLLPVLTPVDYLVSLATIEANFSKGVRLNHHTYDSRQTRPISAMAGYQPENTPALNNAMLGLMLDNTAEEKRAALVAFTQHAIDRAYAVKAGYRNGGIGHDPNHRVLAAWAAVLLDLEDVATVLSTATGFHEDVYLYNGINAVLWGESTTEGQYWDFIMGLGGSRSRKDPYGYIDGGSLAAGYAAYQFITAQSLKGQALVYKLMPELAATCVEASVAKLQTYAERWVEVGTWASPDPAAPYDGVVGNYGATFGPNGTGSYIAGGGRWPLKHGSSTDSGQYKSWFVAAMWTAYWDWVEPGSGAGPTVPGSVAAAAQTIESIEVTWDGSGVTGHDGYRIERSLTAESGFVQVGTAADDAESYRDNDLTPGVQYYYRIRSYNATGNGDYSTVADATTPVISGRSVRPQSAGGAGLW